MFTFSLGLQEFPAISKEDEKLAAKNHYKYKETRHQDQEPAEMTAESACKDFWFGNYQMEYNLISINGRESFKYE